MPDVDDMWDDEEDGAMFSRGHRDRVALGLARPAGLAAAQQPAHRREAVVARAILVARFYDCEPEAYGGLEDFFDRVWPDHGYDALYEARAALIAAGLRLPVVGNSASDPSALATDIIAARLEWKQGGDDRNLTDATAAYLVSKGWTRGPDQAAVDAAERRGMEIMREMAIQDVAEWGTLFMGNGDSVTADVIDGLRALPITGGDDAA